MSPRCPCTIPECRCKDCDLLAAVLALLDRMEARYEKHEQGTPILWSALKEIRAALSPAHSFTPRVESGPGGSDLIGRKCGVCGKEKKEHGDE